MPVFIIPSNDVALRQHQLSEKWCSMCKEVSVQSQESPASEAFGVREGFSSFLTLQGFRMTHKGPSVLQKGKADSVIS
jgi:hypothetical protein